VWLVRQGAGRPAEPQVVEALRGTVAHHCQLVDARLGGDLRRSQDLQRDIPRADGQLAALLE